MNKSGTKYGIIGKYRIHDEYYASILMQVIQKEAHMNITQYEALVRAVESGTMTEAARELGYSQSGLTRALNSLEQEWGVKLLLRGRSGVRLTAEGQILMPLIRTVMNDQLRLNERIDEITGLREGLIRVGTFNSVSAQWLPGIIKQFRKEYPGIRFELLHGTDEQINAWILDGRVDVGFIAYPGAPELDSDFLYRDPIVSIFADSDPHAKLSTFPIAELPRLPYIALYEGVEDEITAILAQNRIQPDTKFMESDDHAVIAMVEQGLGTSLMSMMMLQGFDRRITAVPLDPPGHRDLGVACRGRQYLSAAARKFYDCICDWVKNEYVVHMTTCI